MTNKEFFVTTLAVLAATFDRKLSPPAIEGYWMALSDLAEDEFKAATAKALASCKFMPSPAELLAFARPPRNLAVEAAMSWEAVRVAMDKYDYTDSVDFGPLVNAVVNNMGGWDLLCQASIPDLVWRRKDFERLYAEFAVKPLDHMRTGYLVGAFKGAPHRIAIGGNVPPPQLESVERNSVAGIVGALARDKS